MIQIWLYIAQDDSDAADSVIDFLYDQFATLATMPTMGRIRRDLWPEAMCFITFKPRWRSRFLVFYQTVPGGIEVARVIESHRDLSALDL